MVSYLGVWKFKVLRVARIRSIDKRNYYLGGIKLDRIDVEKDLGVLVSHNLSWNNHVDLISSKAQRMLHVLYRRYRDINDISTMKLPYIYCLGSFCLEYSRQAWYGLLIPNEICINNLKEVQRRATRFVLGRYYSEYERLSKLKFVTFEVSQRN